MDDQQGRVNALIRNYFQIDVINLVVLMGLTLHFLYHHPAMPFPLTLAFAASLVWSYRYITVHRVSFRCFSVVLWNAILCSSIGAIGYIVDRLMNGQSVDGLSVVASITLIVTSIVCVGIINNEVKGG